MLRYRSGVPGGWLAVAGPGRILVVRATNDDAAVTGVLAAADGEERGVLDLLTIGGLSATPSFALLSTTSGPGGALNVRVFVRGELVVRLERRDGELELSGREATTWLERSTDGVTRFSIDTGSDGGIELPLQGGAVWIGSLSGGADPAPNDALQRADAAAAWPASALAEEPAGEIDDSTVAVARTPRMPVTAPVPQNDDGSGEPMSEQTIVEFAADEVAGSTMLRGDDAVPASTGAAPAIELPAFITGSQPRPVPAAGSSGDHDGLTVLSGDIRALRSGLPGAPTAAAPGAQDPRVHIVLPDGETDALERPVVVGRAPRAGTVAGGTMPRLVTVDSADQDISRTHLQFRLEGDSVVVTDLHSRNGTLIVLPGKSPRKLRAGEPTTVIAGTIVDLGGGIVFRVVEE
ncbi:FHA domain-containing protein [Luethyella okanaganae]|uniref:FHA domain-containing protein n=1 Tax=Luethyella okanaganae TaxID=69372 RepID=A0ABW1VCK5_9MICO